ncbi:DUF4136 domain-containing protein [Neiella marina]|uniref:DUF4136 domain-containing protein n=1 Tax=Neiella holothuriorum TaxID=2870530 RepID=A0ABS7EF21_9GAMM|nr:DUF4136 domain-containing protein [Neiella holothuriorum]MBW8190918.1 DUF4136 domain-containing protein [Neiella holothuriorum]
MKNKQPLGTLLMAAMAMLLAGCASTPKVEADYANDFNFAHLETFYMVPISNNTYAGQPGYSLTDQRINESVKTYLTNRGMKEVPAEHADVLVSHYVTSEDKTQVRTHNTRYAHSSRYNRYAVGHGWGNDISVRQFTEGQLLIDLVNPKTDLVVWRGVGSKKLKSSANSEQKTDTINEYVEAMFSEVPGW